LQIASNNKARYYARMDSSKNMRWFGCPVRYSGGLLGDKWSLLLIRDLMFKGRRNYSDFLDDDESIASNVLADRLGKLVEAGIFTKSRDPKNGKKYVYTLTEKGRDILPILMEMFRWAQKHDDKTFVSQQYIDNMDKSPKRFMKSVLKEVQLADDEALRKKTD